MWGYNLWKTTYKSVEKRDHFRIGGKELYNTKNYLRNTFRELMQFVNFHNQFSENKPETKPTPTIPETTETTETTGNYTRNKLRLTITG